MRIAALIVLPLLLLALISRVGDAQPPESPQRCGGMPHTLKFPTGDATICLTPTSTTGSSR